MTEVPGSKPNTNTTDGFANDSTNPFGIHLLDVGTKQDGDAVLCGFGNVSVLIDGAHRGNYQDEGTHPSLPRQLRYLLGQPAATTMMDLLICTHLHDDHIGSLPELVKFKQNSRPLCVSRRSQVSLGDHAPYEFVKLVHHGSWNGFSKNVLSNLRNTTLRGLCTGSKSGHRPATSVLELLKFHKDDLTWVRTDRMVKSR